MKTISLYEKTHTWYLRLLLKEYEKTSENNQLLIEKAKLRNENYRDLEIINNDYEIDIHLIRMELNKRLWFNK